MIKTFSILLLVCLALSGCTQITLDWAALSPKGPSAQPALLAPLGDQGAVTDQAQWTTQRRGQIQKLLQAEIYGVLPKEQTTTVTARRVVDPQAFGNRGQFEEIDIMVAPAFGAGQSAQFTMALAIPHSATGQAGAPIILMQTFCPRWRAMPNDDATMPEGTDPDEKVPAIFRFAFGRYICRPPLEAILDAGYAVAVVDPGDVVPDDAETGLAALARLSADHPDDTTRWGAIAAWGWTFSRMVDVISDDPRFDQERMISWGHSRFGKAALVAAAFDPRIDGVIAHQSGTGGASLNRQKRGETIGAITRSYPHWFSRQYATYQENEAALTLDQHHLLALVAPRPLLLGNARRDVWSDPNGAFRAAQGAADAWTLYGLDALPQDRLDRFAPQQPISFWLRPGTHGVVQEDWPAFLAFLDAHFGAPAEGGTR